MPVKLITTIKEIASIPNPINSTLLSEFCQYMKSNGASVGHQNNNLKTLISVVYGLISIYDVDRIYIDRANPSFIKSLKLQIGEDPDYDKAIARV